MSEDDSKKEAGRLGGIARKDALPAEERKAIAQAAALARWGAKATHRGNFLEQFGIDVDCYVIDDPQKTGVVSQRGMGSALGMGVGGSRLPNFVNSKRMTHYVGHELRQKLENPLIFQLPPLGMKAQPPTPIHGYDVTMLIDLCQAVARAEADGKKINPAVVKQAHIILSASAKSGIKNLVWALAGYDPTRQEVIEAFKFYLREEARQWEKEFPDQLYDEWYRLYELPKLPKTQRPYKFKHLTVGHIWEPLARSKGQIYQLTRQTRAEGAETKPSTRYRKLHQFLSEIGVKALRLHLGQVLGIAQTSDTKGDYEARIDRAFGVQRKLNF